MRLLSERDPELSEHVAGVAELAVGVAERLGLTPAQLRGRARRRRAARRRQARDPGLDPQQARPARRRRVGVHVPPHADRRADPRVHARPRRRRRARPREPRAARRPRLPRRASRGDEIPFGARIVAVCDAYDAMVSDRPYRRGMPPAAALRELRAGAPARSSTPPSWTRSSPCTARGRSRPPPEGPQSPLWGMRPGAAAVDLPGEISMPGRPDPSSSSAQTIRRLAAALEPARPGPARARRARAGAVARRARPEPGPARSPPSCTSTARAGCRARGRASRSSARRLPRLDGLAPARARRGDGRDPARARRASARASCWPTPPRSRSCTPTRPPRPSSTARSTS